MKKDVTKLRNVTIIILLVSPLFWSRFMLIADGIFLLLWIDYFFRQNAFCKLIVSRDVSKHRLFVRENYNLQIRIQNPTWFSFSLTCVPATEGSGEMKQQSGVQVPSKQIKEIVFTGTFFHRGNKQLGNTILVYESLFGLYRLSHSLSFQDDIIAFPVFPEIIFGKEALKDLLPGHKTDYRMLEDPTHIKNVRDYSGEPIQRIHWKISAKMDRLMVKEFEYSAIGSVKIILNLNLPDTIFARGVWSKFRKDYEEHVIPAVGSLLRYLKTHGSPLELTILGKEIWTSHSKTRDYIYDLEKLVSSVGTDNPEFFLKDALSMILPKIQYSDTVVLFGMHLSEEDIPLLLQIRTLCSKVIAFLLPYGFRSEESIPRESFLSAHPDLKEVLNRSAILAENQIHVEFLTDNTSLQEAINLVP
jgi:uncharacterized protein (DUF58 family)